MTFHPHPGACRDAVCSDQFGIEGAELFSHIYEPGQIIIHPVTPLLCFDLIISGYITRLQPGDCGDAEHGATFLWLSSHS
jgi:hypothetical protein